MANARPFVSAGLVGLALAVILGTLPSLPLPGAAAGLAWGRAHVAMAVFGFILPVLGALVWHVAGARMPRPLGDARFLALLWFAGASLMATGQLRPSLDAVAFLGTLALLAAGCWQTALVMRAVPRRKESVVDIAADPLSKGDDASLAHVRFAHMVFLPLALLGMALSHAPGLDGTLWTRLQLASYHWLLAGFALLCVYGASHIVVPRLSGVPAIAAGAIKGELHSSLLGLVLLAAGFLADAAGLLIAGGAFLFLGAFVFMGVLGANIMKNKSPTQRVTPQYAYIPWTFSGVFWLVAGVLLGLFLSPAQALADRAALPDRLLAALSFTHVHAALLGGFAQLALGFATRLVATAAGLPPVPFGRTRWSFFALNAGLVLLCYGQLTSGPRGTAYLSGAALVLVSLAAWFISHLPSLRPRP